jgi:hypothetical protein
MTKFRPSLLSRRLYQVFGLACGFGLIDFGFNTISVGIQGAGTFTSQFLAANLLLGGSILVFVSLFYLLKPISPVPAQPAASSPAGTRPDVGVELIVEEQTPPKPGFYKSIEYIGYFFAFLGLISAADLVMQVFLRSTYNEARWWIEVLLVTFGVLSYTILGSVGRLGSQEEAKLAKLPSAGGPPKLEPELTSAAPAVAPAAGTVASPETMEALTFRLADFARNSEGEYEKHLSGESYDMFRADPDMVTVWREDRRAMRSVYLAGPYELSRKMLEDYLSKGQELRVGKLVLSADSIRGLLDLTKSPKASDANVSAQPEV